MSWPGRLSASPAFQRFAFGFPLTRGVARRRAGALFDLAAGFVFAQVLAACVALDLFAWTAERPRSAEALAARASLSPDAAARLLDAAAALGLLRRRRGLFSPGPIGAPLAGPGGAGVAAMIGHHAAFYRDLADPLALLRGEGRTGLAAFWPYAGESGPSTLGPQDAGPYSALMAASQDFVAADVLDALRYRGGGPWLDLAGGSGVFLEEAARRAPRLRGAVLELPPVADLAGRRFAEAGLSGRLEAIAGDVRQPPPPPAYAVVSLVRVLHDHDDAAALDILRAARRALKPGGRLVIAEPMRGRPQDARITDAYFGLYLLAMGQGRLRTPADIARLARAAGFEGLRERRTRRPFLVRLLVGR